MVRDVLCIHRDGDVRSHLAAAAAEVFTTDQAVTLEEGASQHGRSPFDVVLVELDDRAAVVRAIQDWHPVPAIVTVGADMEDAVDLALTSGAHDHIEPDASPRDIAVSAERSWRRHRAGRTRRSTRPPTPDMHDVRRRVAQLVSLTSAAKDLLGIDEPPHTTVRSLLDQVAELGNETVQLTGRAAGGEPRTELELRHLVESAWGDREPRGTTLTTEIEPIELHGHASMVRTALIVLFTHALRGEDQANRVHVDTVVLPDAVRLRVHDDGPPIGLSDRRVLFVGGVEHGNPMLMTVEHVASRHGGTAWLADSDVIHGGTVAVLELPRRVARRTAGD